MRYLRMGSGTPRRHRSAGDTGGNRRTLTVGLLLVTVFGPLVVSLASLLPETLLTRRYGVPMVAVEFTGSLLPPVEEGDVDVSAWLGTIIADVTAALLAAIYFGGAALALAGGGLIVVSVLAAASLQSFVMSVRSLVGYRPVQVLLTVYLLIAVGAVYPIVLLALGEVVLAFLVAAPLVGLIGAAVSRLRYSRTSLYRVGVLYPLTTLLLVLPVATVGVISPTLAPIVWSISNEIAILLLETVFAAAGLEPWLRRQFDLEGAGLVAMWAGIGYVVGITAGAVLETTGRVPTLLRP